MREEQCLSIMEKQGCCKGGKRDKDCKAFVKEHAKKPFAEKRAEALRVWANDIEGGKFDDIKPEEYDHWAHYTSYVCGLATNGSCCHGFLDRTRKLDPDMDYLEEVSRLYKRIGEMWNNDNGTDLEAIGGGFNVTLEALQDKDKRTKIAAKIRECGDVIDEVLRVLNAGLAILKLLYLALFFVGVGCRNVPIDIERNKQSKV